jgi:hypothetical protein
MGGVQQREPVQLHLPRKRAEVQSVEAPKPENAAYVGAIYSESKALDSCAPNLSSISLATAAQTACGYDLRQEPDAVTPHVRICGGGAQQWAFLLRLGLCRNPL